MSYKMFSPIVDMFLYAVIQDPAPFDYRSVNKIEIILERSIFIFVWNGESVTFVSVLSILRIIYVRHKQQCFKQQCENVW